MKHFKQFAMASLVGATLPGLAMADSSPTTDDDGLVQDEFDDLLEEGESTVREERRSLEDEADRNMVQVELPEMKKKVIKTLQPKQFMKIGRAEFMPYIGYIPNDPFVHRIQFGGSFAFHPTEVLGIELNAAYSPSFGENGEGDLKGITNDLVEENEVVPQVSRLMWHATANFQYAPIYGKIATTRGNTITFDLFGVFGLGAAGVSDDVFLGTDGDPDPEAIDQADQVLFTMSVGGGLRMAFNRTVALRFDVRTLSYINSRVQNSTLEVKNNLALSIGPSFFFGGKAQ